MGKKFFKRATYHKFVRDSGKEQSGLIMHNFDDIYTYHGSVEKSCLCISLKKIIKSRILAMFNE